MSEPTSWLNLAASLLLWLSAGVCIYLFLLNRYLLLLTDGLKKTLVLRGSMFAIGGAALLSGWWAAGMSWLAFAPPIGVLALFAAGEVRRSILRRQSIAAPPVETENAGIKLRSPITTTDLATYRYELAVPHWQGRRLRIAHVSDLHLNGDLPTAYYEQVMARVARAEPDLLIFTGDLVTKVKYAADLPWVLTLARGKLATLAILGNHDYWVGPEPVAAAVESSGVTLLTDRCIRLSVEGQEVLVCGYEKPWSRGAWQPPQVAPGALGLLLTHTPDNVYRLSRLGYTAIFAGHYHAGQVRLPWLGPIITPSRYGRRFDHGHFVVDGTHLFITAGVGSAVPPRRIYCQPDIFFVDIGPA
jgi:predicted MPP superfamily phosphohydrolase